MAHRLQSLIDKQDTVEIVRDLVGQILLEEEAQQRSFAAEADPPQDPELYRLRVYTERSNPWDEFQNEVSPIVHVAWDDSQFNRGNSTHLRQQTAARYNLDCYGLGRSIETAPGHAPGDQGAALEAQRAARLVRNVLMSAHHHKLGLQNFKTIQDRWIESATSFQPEYGGAPVEHVHAVRLVLLVEFEEQSPQYEAETLEQLTLDVHRDTVTGQLLLTQTHLYEQEE